MTLKDEAEPIKSKSGEADAGGGPQMTMRERGWLEQCLARGRRELFFEIVAISPAVAAELLRRNTHNRPFSSGRAAKYAKVIADGRWRVTPEALMIDRNGVLEDGQHRLGGIVQSGCTVKMMIWFGCDPADFAVINTGGARTVANTAAIAGYSNYALRASVAGFVYRLKTPNSSQNPDSNLIFRTLEEAADEDMDEAIRFGNAARSQNLCNGTAAALAHWYIAKNTTRREKMADFCSSFLTGANLSERSAILRIRNIIKVAIIEPNSRQLAFKQAAAIVLAWNAWLGSRYLNSVAWSSVTKLPEVK